MTDKMFQDEVFRRLDAIRSDGAGWLDRYIFGGILIVMFVRGCDAKPCDCKCPAAGTRPTTAPESPRPKGDRP